MTGLEVIPQIAALITKLIARVKDAKTAAIVLEIQTLFQTLQAAYFAAEKESTESGRKCFALEQANAKLESQTARLKQEQADAITQLKNEHAAEIARFQKATDYAKGEGFSSSAEQGNRVGRPPGF